MLDRLEPGEQSARHPGAVDPHRVMVRASLQLNKRLVSAAELTTCAIQAYSSTSKCLRAPDQRIL